MATENKRQLKKTVPEFAMSHSYSYAHAAIAALLITEINNTQKFRAFSITFGDQRPRRQEKALRFGISNSSVGRWTKRLNSKTASDKLVYGDDTRNYHSSMPLL